MEANEARDRHSFRCCALKRGASVGVVSAGKPRQFHERLACLALEKAGPFVILWGENFSKKCPKAGDSFVVVLKGTKLYEHTSKSQIQESTE